MGLIFSAFSWTYALAQIPGGVLLDRLGSRLTYGLSLFTWSLATMVHGLMSSVAGLFSARLALGLAEAPCYPTNGRDPCHLVSADRAGARQRRVCRGPVRGTGIPDSRAHVDRCHLGMARAVLPLRWHRRGVLGVLVSATTAIRRKAVARTRPSCDHIAAAEGSHRPARHCGSPGRGAIALLRKRQILGAAIGQFCGNSTLVFFLTWFPSYLATERGMDWIRSGFAASLPYIAASVGVLAGGRDFRCADSTHGFGHAGSKAAHHRRFVVDLD